MANTKRAPTPDRSVDFMGAVDGWVIAFGRRSIRRLRSHYFNGETSITHSIEKQPISKDWLYRYILHPQFLVKKLYLHYEFHKTK
jgi:hypothetical protein